VELNAWLKASGYLVTKEGAEERDLLQAIDWTQTRAYAVGFGGIFLNIAGREAHGILKPGPEIEALKAEIRERLLRLRDDEKSAQPIREVYDRNVIYSGPYLSEAPDLLVGMRVGYRVAWETVTGRVGRRIFEDNVRPWSGDHNMNPPDVPGMLFCNRIVNKTQPHIMDIGPSVLDLFGLPVPGYCDGEPLFPAGAGTRTQ
jgi:predicted AlkP superfamily phosphohydrolase/phosphomutase